MNLHLHALPETNGITLHLAIQEATEIPEGIEFLLGRATPTEKIIIIHHKMTIAGINCTRAMNDIYDRGWTVFGSGYTLD